MADIRQVETPRRPLAPLGELIGEERYAALLALGAQTLEELGGATVWNVSSTASGGGVAEMLHVLLGYTLDVALDVRWFVVSGDADFFAVTKTLHNHLHGAPGAGSLTAGDREHYRATTDRFGEEMAALVRPGDVVLLHDPQTAGMAARLAGAGAHVVWRCHVGVDEHNRWTDEAWEMLHPHLAPCARFVFSRESYAPDWIDPAMLAVIRPSIDPFSPKNEELEAAEVAGILVDAGILAGDRGSAGRFCRGDGSEGRVQNEAVVLRDGGPLDPAVPVVLQVSRWDRLKDMAGVMAGFVECVPSDLHAHLLLAGPATAGVSDDPEGAAVLAECTAARQALDPSLRQRVSLVSLPMDDLEENAAMVNALQRHASVVVQKSLAEGFGLTVAEAMWKSRPVVASAVGGIRDQIADGTGILLQDPADRGELGAALNRLLRDPAAAQAMGAAARRHVLDGFVGDHHLAAYAQLVIDLYRAG